MSAVYDLPASLCGIPPTDFTLNAHSPQARDLLGWWPTSGQSSLETLYDYSGYDRHLAQANSPTETLDPDIGQARLYSAASTQYYEADFPSAFVDRPLTLTCWAWCTDTSNSPPIGLFNSANDDRYVSVYFNAGNTINCAQRSTSHKTASAAAAQNTLYHIACRVVAQTSMQLFLNGVQVDTETGDAGATALGIDRVSIGRWGDPSPFSYMEGGVGDARLYGRALSDAEIWHQYDPATRWDLYAPVARVYAVPTLAAATVVPQISYHFRRRRAG